MPPSPTAAHTRGLRWGFVGTGNISNWMADVLRSTPGAVLAAVASRSSASADAFATRHGAGRGFGSWVEMLRCKDVDAVYVATPTALREEIGVAAADAGKHVLAEKPFASLPSLQRITAACRANGVCFMDATHFVHHPRTTAVLKCASEIITEPQSLDSSFLIPLPDRGNIRYDPALEPLGALGDLGWYNVRATLEYLAPVAGLRSASTRLRRDPTTLAIIAGDGSLSFEDGTRSAWRFGFNAETPEIGLRLSGACGHIEMDNFVGEEPDGSASYRFCKVPVTQAAATRVSIESRFSGPSLMFQDFSAAASDAALRDRWMQASERTQALLDEVLRVAEVES